MAPERRVCRRPTSDHQSIGTSVQESGCRAAVRLIVARQTPAFSGSATQNPTVRVPPDANLGDRLRVRSSASRSSRVFSPSQTTCSSVLVAHVVAACAANLLPSAPYFFRRKAAFSALWAAFVASLFLDPAPPPPRLPPPQPHGRGLVPRPPRPPRSSARSSLPHRQWRW